MSKSQRHHYIPRFFIKQFCDDDGLIYIFDKEKNKILKNRQSPKGSFFEDDRNTVDFSGQKLDNLELIYSALDNNLATDYLKVLKNETVTPEELTSITLLANLLKWRVPKSDKEFDEIKNDLSQTDLGVRIEIKDKSLNIDKKAIEHIENSDIFKETKRIMLSILPLTTPNKLLEIHNNSFLQMNPVYPALLGDNPIIMKNGTGINQINDFVFPLSSETTFIYKQNSKRNMNNPLFFFHRDLSIFKNSTKYVGCKSKEHLEKIIEMYNKLKNDGNLEQIEGYIFNYID